MHKEVKESRRKWKKVEKVEENFWRLPERRRNEKKVEESRRNKKNFRK